MDVKFSGSACPPVRQSFSYLKWLCVALIVIGFHSRRLTKPTILGDDVIRLVDARTLPLMKQLFRPFSEHVAPGFELATAAITRPLENHLNLMPVAFTLFALGSWLLFLAVTAGWVRQITGSSDIAAMTVAFTGVSSACLEVPWWFSAATYSLSAAAIFAVLWAIALTFQPEMVNRDSKWKSQLVIAVVIGSLTGASMSFSALGLMAVILGSIAAMIQTGFSKSSFIKIGAILSGLGAYMWACQFLGGDLIDAAAKNNRHMTDIIRGLMYAASVPGGVTFPLFLGVDARWLTTHFQWLSGLFMSLIVVIAIWAGYRLNCYSRMVMWLILSLLIAPYLVIYPTRAGLVSDGRWAEPDFLYFWTSRYHLFAIVGLALFGSSLIKKALVRIPRTYIRQFLKVGICVIAAILQSRNTAHWSWMMDQPDQAGTLSALMQLQAVVDNLNVPDSQLLRIFPPVRRGWNASVQELRPDAFPLVRLISERMDDDRPETQGDELVSERIYQAIGQENWLILRSGRLLNLDSVKSLQNGQEIIIKADVLEKAEQEGPSRWKILDYGGYLEFSIRDFKNTESVILESVKTDGPIAFQWTMNSESWDDRRSAWFETKAIDHQPVPERFSFSKTDFYTTPTDINQTGRTVRLRVKPLRPGPFSIGSLTRTNTLAKP
jgi:hypothetical protein